MPIGHGGNFWKDLGLNTASADGGCGKKIARNNLYVSSLTTTFEPQRPNQCDGIAENLHAIVPWMCRDRVDRHHR
jgi:hypothetical protein